MIKTAFSMRYAMLTYESPTKDCNECDRHTVAPGSKKDSGTAIRPKNIGPNQFWDIIHGQEGGGEAQEEFP